MNVDFWNSGIFSDYMTFLRMMNALLPWFFVPIKSESFYHLWKA